jgi:hypothetical protein
MLSLYLKQDRDTDVHRQVVTGDDSHVWTFIHEILFGNQVLGLGPRQARIDTWLLETNEGSTPHDDGDDSVWAITRY